MKKLVLSTLCAAAFLSACAPMAPSAQMSEPKTVMVGGAAMSKAKDIIDNASYEDMKKSRTAVKTLRTSLEKEQKDVVGRW